MTLDTLELIAFAIAIVSMFFVIYHIGEGNGVYKGLDEAMKIHREAWKDFYNKTDADLNADSQK